MTLSIKESSLSFRDEESQEETAKVILRYLEDSDDLKVSVTELQEQRFHQAFCPAERPRDL